MSTNKLKDDITDRLFEAIMQLKTQKEYYKFFEDICTVNELKSFAQRFEVATMLKNGSTYEEVVDKTGMSTATIARIKRCLNYGPGGYRLVLNRMEAQKKGEKDAQK